MDRRWNFSFERFEGQQSDNPFGVHTDHEIFWGEVMKHPNASVGGEESYNINAGLRDYLPKKAEEYGIKQAYVEALVGLRSKGYSASECMQYLRLDSSDIKELEESKAIIRFRIFPGDTTSLVKETAAEYFKSGYEKGCKAVSWVICDTKLASEVSEIGNRMAYEMIKNILTKEGYAEYCELYGTSVD